jgi:hypothetical protein
MSFTATSIAEAPADALGREYYDTFTNFVERNMLDHYLPSKAIATSIALDVFFLRYSLAYKYGTMFAKQMVDNGTLYWKRRFKGKSNGESISWAVKGNERTGQLWEWLSQACGRQDAVMSDFDFGDTPIVPEIQITGWAVETRQWRIRVCDMPGFSYYCYIQQPVAYPHVFIIQHVDDCDVPGLVEVCNKYAFSAMSGVGTNFSTEERVEALARFEYLWFWVNPFGRAGAISGDVISFLITKYMAKQGIEISNRKSYYHQDFLAFSMNINDYIDHRKVDLLGKVLAKA